MLSERKIRQRFLLSVFIVAICILPGCAKQDTTVIEGSKEIDSNQNVVDATNNDYSCYDDLIETVTLGLKNGFTVEEMNTLPITTCFYNSFFTIGYARLDIDGNGIEELLFGEYGNDGFGQVIYDIYTISNGEMLHTVFGWERNYYFLCGNGIIGNHGSNGAASNINAYFKFHGQVLWGENYDNEGFVESVIYDGWRDEVHPWFYSTTKPRDENAEPISEEQAYEIIRAYKPQSINFTPFTW